ncbi:MAG: hypothetical protein ABI718_12270 [Acidobacteriota bacterium]
MKPIILIVPFLVLSLPASGQHDMHNMGDAHPSATLEQGLGNLHHPVSTKNAQAQRFFDQGLTLLYAFNHGEAIKSFTQAADLDPGMAMAYWGVALALGPNINLDVDPDREKAAYNAVQQARNAAANGPENERAYIAALARRYSVTDHADLHQLAVDYSKAMGELSERYPDDPDAAVLYAESMMDLRPWALWSADGKPAEGTEKIVAVLESVLKRNPDHVGANHYYIHTMEASPHPERALMSARRLESLVPAAGHLVHMPAHIYMRTGNFEGAVESNARAAEVDRRFIKTHGDGGVYPLMYYNHNISFLSAAESMAGNYAGAIKSAIQLEANLAPVAKEMAMVEPFMATSALVFVRFRKWDEILKSEESHYGSASNALWHFARGMALAAKGNPAEANKELATIRAATGSVPADALIGLNSTQKVLSVAAEVLEARVARATGNSSNEIAALRRAVAAEDTLRYDEPADWFYPVRESLGGALLMAGENSAAEGIFREDLERNPGNGRSLFGLAEALRRQRKTVAAEMVTVEFERAWKFADTKLGIEDL